MVLDSDVVRQPPDEPVFAVGKRHRLVGRHRHEPRGLSGLEPLGKPPRTFTQPSRGDHRTVIHLHVGRGVSPILHGEFGAEIEHLGGWRQESKPVHTLRHPHHGRAHVEKRLEFADQFQLTGAFEEDLNAVAERDFDCSAQDA